MPIRLSVINNARDRLGVGSIEAFVGLKTDVGPIVRMTEKSIFVDVKGVERLFRGCDHKPCVLERFAKAAKARDKYQPYAERA